MSTNTQVPISLTSSPQLDSPATSE